MITSTEDMKLISSDMRKALRDEQQRYDMEKLVRKLASLNPEAGEIGEGMLRILVTKARRLTE